MKQTLQQYDPIHPHARVSACRPVGLYLHVPYCRRKCGYCDFYSIAAGADTMDRFVDRVIDEASVWAAADTSDLSTVFVGGGTPTTLGAERWAKMVGGVFDALRLREASERKNDWEFTVETNPETTDDATLDALLTTGVNRLSIGAQSFQPHLLEALDREHRPKAVGDVVRRARRAGIENISLDLIFAIPGQTIDQCRADLDAALALEPDHLSCYGLTYEPGTPLHRQRERAKVIAADEAIEAEMYELVIDQLTTAGCEHYEISNFARPGRRCQHNMNYWLGRDWLALGPSAAGYVSTVRWSNRADLAGYLASKGPAPIEHVEQLEPNAALGEQLMLRLRLIEGVKRDWLDGRLDARRAESIEAFVSDGLLEWTPTHLRLTRRGLMIADSVMAELL